MAHEQFSHLTTIENGIERITFVPDEKRFTTPILFIHGMWHGAWVWETWQKRFAAMGWESHAISLPGHGASPARGPVRFATMGQYLRVVAAEARRLSPMPILVGHSMGGALVQWYLRKVADDLPAAVLLSSWTARSTYGDGLLPLMRRDPIGGLLISLTFSSSPYLRNPRRVRETLLSPGSTVDPVALKARLCEESALVLNQHNPPFWRPLRAPKTPLLWVAAGADGVVTPRGARKSAAFYGAHFQLVEGDGHNLMMEAHEAETAEMISDWLARTVPNASS